MAYQRLVRKLTKENLWLWILRILSEGPKYAHEIVDELRNRYRVTPATVTVYVVLYKMKREGLVGASSIVGRPGRIRYEMTEKGRQALEQGRAFLREVLEAIS